MLSDQSRIIEQAKFTYSSLGKGNKKTNKRNWRSRNKTSWGFKSFKTRRKPRPFPNKMKTNEIKNEIDEIKKWEEKIKRKDLKYEKIYIWFSTIWNDVVFQW